MAGRRKVTPSFVDAVASDDRLVALKALRDRLASEITSCESKRDLAALSQRLMDALEQIDRLKPAKKAEAEKGTGLSDFERRLRQRESASSAPRRATR